MISDSCPDLSRPTSVSIQESITSAHVLDTKLSSYRSKSAHTTTMNTPSRDTGDQPQGKPAKNPPGGTQKKQKGPTTITSKFSGHNQEDLKGFIITDDGTTSASQQFKELQERLVTLGSTKYAAEVGRSIKDIEVITIKEFMPSKPTNDMWTSFVLDANGDRTFAADGSPITSEDADIKDVLTDMYSQQVKDNSRAYAKYLAGLKSMFQIIVGQISPNMMEKLKSDNDWTATEKSFNTVKLLAKLRDLCYQDARTKVHRPTNVIRALRRLVCSRQRSGDCAAYIREVTDRFNVLKAIGGGIICDELIKAVLDSEDPKISFMDYNKMDADRKQTYKNKAEQEVLASIMI